MPSTRSGRQNAIPPAENLNSRTNEQHEELVQVDIRTARVGILRRPNLRNQIEGCPRIIRRTVVQIDESSNQFFEIPGRLFGILEEREVSAANGFDDPPVLQEPANDSLNNNESAQPQWCASCQKAIEHHEYFDISPCHHTYCCSCFAVALLSTMQASNGHERRVSCAANGCGQCIRSHRHFTWRETTHEPTNDVAVVHNEQIEQRDIRHSPDPSKDPLRSFFKEVPAQSDRVGKGFIYMAVGEGDGKMKTKLSKFNALDGFGQEEKMALVDIFRLLHPLMFPKYLNTNDDDDDEEDATTMNPEQLVDYAINHDDHIALPCLYALGTGAIYNGESKTEFLKGTSYKRSAFLGCFVAKEMLLRVGQKNPSRFQKCLADTVYTLTRCRMLLEILSEFRIAASWATMVSYSKKRDEQILSKQLSLPKRCFTIFVMDNLNFTVKGAKASNDQWTTLSIYVITEEQLKAAGFYQDDDPQKRISREKKTRASFLANPNCRNVPKVTEADYKTVSFYTLQHIKTVMGLSLPSHADCCTIERGRDFTTSYIVPCNLGIDLTPRKKGVDDSRNRIVHFPLPYPSDSEN